MDNLNNRRMQNILNDLSAREWVGETVSVFLQKGLGKNHKDTKIEKLHPAPFSYQDISRLIKFFTKINSVVLDPFVGVGSTLKACAIERRYGIGIELQKKYCDLSLLRLQEELDKETLTAYPQKIINADIRKAIKDLPDNSIDFIVTSPPYWNILNKIDHKAKQERIGKGLETKYSDDRKDLANIPEYNDYLCELSKIFEMLKYKLRPKKYIAVIVSDFRHKSKYYMLHADLANSLSLVGYELKGITVLYQSRKRVFPYGYPYAYVPNIHNQFIIIMQRGEEC
jgi:DNA modification methylase